MRSTVISALAVAALGATSAAQAPAAAPVAQANTVCGAQQFCYETADFAAAVTDFRTTTQGYYHIVDVTVRFVNKTANPLGLGYASGSGIVTDDRGNRYIVGGANGLRGMGLVYGPGNFDPKFEMQPGGFGDSRFELLLQGGGQQQILGFTFELDLTVNEIASYQGNQHSLGGEFPLQFKGLANATSTPAPGQVTYASGGAVSGFGSPAPCATTGGTVGTAASIANATNSASVQNATTGATTVASNASAAVSNIASIFGHKKPAAAANAAAPVPCATAAPVATAPMPVATTPAAAPTMTAAPARSVATAPKGPTPAATAAAMKAPPTTATVAPVVKTPTAIAAPAKAPTAPPKPATATVPAKTPAPAATTATQPKPQAS